MQPSDGNVALQPDEIILKSKTPDAVCTRVRTGASDIGSTAAFTPSADVIFPVTCVRGSAPAQPLTAQHMDRKVVIAELEPVLTSKSLNLGHETQVSLQAPTP